MAFQGEAVIPVSMVLSRAKDDVDYQLGEIMGLFRSGLRGMKSLEKAITSYKQQAATGQVKSGDSLGEQVGDIIDMFRSGLGELKTLEKTVTVYERVADTQQTELAKCKAQAAAHAEAAHVAKPKLQAQESTSTSSKHLTNHMLSKPYFLILIDADSYILSEVEVLEGNAVQLRDRLEEHLVDYVDACKSQLGSAMDSFSIHVKIFHNLHGQLRAIHRFRPGLKAVVYKQALRDFTKDRDFWDVIDVGAVAQAADKKIIANLLHHSHDPACLKLFLGGTHDNGYAEHLERLAAEHDMAKKITLITAWTTRSKYMSLPFEIVVWRDVFEHDPINPIQARLEGHPPPWPKAYKETYRVKCLRGVWTATPAWEGMTPGDDETSVA